MRTPWGQSDNVYPLGKEGLLSVTTASHGGIYVPAHLLSRISAAGQAHAERVSQSRHWYEEDCNWAIVAQAFPALFDDGQRELADILVKQYHLNEHPTS